MCEWQLNNCCNLDTHIVSLVYTSQCLKARAPWHLSKGTVNPAEGLIRHVIFGLKYSPPSKIKGISAVSVWLSLKGGGVG